MRKHLGLMLILTLMPLSSFSAESGRTGAAFLKLPVGARGTGMGEAYSAMSQGVESLYWNPANLALADNIELMLTHNPLVEDVSYNQGALLIKFKKLSLAAGFNDLSYNEIDSFDDGGNALGDFDASDRMGLLGFGVGGKRFRFGVTGKVISSKIDNESASGFAGDVGVAFQSFFGSPLQHALVIQDLGGAVKFVDQEDDLPTSYVFGNTWTPSSYVTVSADFSSVKGTGFVPAGGVEWRPFGKGKNLFSLRGGYTTRRNEIEKLSGASFGGSLNLSRVQFDYAWVPYGELGDGHVISFVWRGFGHRKSRQKEVANPEEIYQDPEESSVDPGEFEETTGVVVLVTLSNGKKIQGRLLRDRGDSIVIKVPNKKITVKKTDILNIKRVTNPGRQSLGDLSQ